MLVRAATGACKDGRREWYYFSTLMQRRTRAALLLLLRQLDYVDSEANTSNYIHSSHQVTAYNEPHWVLWKTH